LFIKADFSIVLSAASIYLLIDKLRFTKLQKDYLPHLWVSVHFIFRHDIICRKIIEMRLFFLQGGVGEFDQIHKDVSPTTIKEKEIVYIFTFQN
jgi:hypothetical protein